MTAADSPPVPRCFSASLLITPFHSRRRAAFTLIEVMVVVVVIGVLSAMLLPAFGGPLQRRKLAGAAGNLHLALRHLQEVAVTHGRTCRLLLKPAVGGEPASYAAEVQAIDREAESAFVTLDDAAVPPTDLPEGVRFGDLRLPPDAADAPGVPRGGAALVFFADGSAGGAVVPLTNGQATWSVVVSPNTGRTSLIEGRVTALPGGREDLDG